MADPELSLLEWEDDQQNVWTIQYPPDFVGNATLTGPSGRPVVIPAGMLEALIHAESPSPRRNATLVKLACTALGALIARGDSPDEEITARASAMAISVAGDLEVDDDDDDDDGDDEDDEDDEDEGEDEGDSDLASLPIFGKPK